MIHAAGIPEHGVKFWAQAEGLLRRGAPVTIEAGDAGRVGLIAGLVPRRSPIVRRRMERLARREAKPIEEFIARKRVQCHEIRDEEILMRFGELGNYPWSRVRRAVGFEHKLIDETGRPLNAWARRLLAKGEKVHARARRDHLECNKIRAHFQKNAGNSGTSPTISTADVSGAS
jgi:hypothetical protein